MRKAENILKLCICIGLITICIWATGISVQSIFDNDFTFFRKLGSLGMALVINSIALAICNSIYQEYKESKCGN